MPRDAAAADVATAVREAELVYFCAQCGRLVTRAAWRLSMNGAHEHVVFNPAGIVFRVACFKEAPGAIAIGAASGEFTWFKGWDWRMAACAGCNAHLGWRYEGDPAPQVFFGLIGAMLVPGPDRQE